MRRALPRAAAARRVAGRPGTPALPRLLLAVGLCGCGPVHLAPYGESGLEGDALAAHARSEGVRLSVTARRWVAPPARVLVQHTPIFVEIENTGDAPLRLRLADVSLEGGSEPALHPEPLERVVTAIGGSLSEARLVRTQGLRPATLQPGQIVHGFLFFRRRYESEAVGQEVSLRVRFVDAEATGEVERIEIPLQVVR